MHLLISTVTALLDVQLNRSVRPLHFGAGCYFGLASDGARSFCLARNESEAAPVMLELDGNLLVTHPLPVIPDVHQMAYRSGLLWLTCSARNSLVAVSVASWEVVREIDLAPFVPASLVRTGEGDLYHVNSLEFLPSGAALVLMNNHDRPSFLLELDGLDAVPALVRCWPSVGSRAHGIDALHYPCPFVVLSSGSGEMKWSDETYVALPGFPRGLRRSGSDLIVCGGEAAPRDCRGDGPTYVAKVSATGAVSFFDLGNFGNGCDVLLLER